MFYNSLRVNSRTNQKTALETLFIGARWGFFGCLCTYKDYVTAGIKAWTENFEFQIKQALKCTNGKVAVIGDDMGRVKEVDSELNGN
mgnify:CR=1 FL=1